MLISSYFVQKMEILPVNDLDIALHEFVNKDDKMAFYSCLQRNLQETRVSVSMGSCPIITPNPKKHSPSIAKNFVKFVWLILSWLWLLQCNLE